MPRASLSMTATRVPAPVPQTERVTFTPSGPRNHFGEESEGTVVRSGAAPPVSSAPGSRSREVGLARSLHAARRGARHVADPRIPARQSSS